MGHRLTDLLALPSADPWPRQYWRWQAWDSLLLARSNLLFNLLQPGEFCQGHSLTFSSFPIVSGVARPSSTVVATQSISEHFHPHGLFCSPPIHCLSHPLACPSVQSSALMDLPFHLHPSLVVSHLLTTSLSLFVGVLNKPPLKLMVVLRGRHS